MWQQDPLKRNTTRHHNPVDLDLNIHRCENLKSRNWILWTTN